MNSTRKEYTMTQQRQNRFSKKTIKLTKVELTRRQGQTEKAQMNK
jgi:hypothetical protein